MWNYFNFWFWLFNICWNDWNILDLREISFNLIYILLYVNVFWRFWFLKYIFKLITLSISVGILLYSRAKNVYFFVFVRAAFVLNVIERKALISRDASRQKTHIQLHFLISSHLLLYHLVMNLVTKFDFKNEFYGSLFL